MKFYFKINNKEYESIDSDKLTVSQYFIISNLLNKELNDFEYLMDLSKNLLIDITDIPNEYIEQLDMNSILQIDWVSYIKDLSNLNKIKKEYSGNKLKDLSDICFGNYIDIDYFYIQNDEQKIIEMVLKDVVSIYNYFISYRTNIFKEFKNLFEYDESDEDDEVEEEPKEVEQSDEKIYSRWLETAYMLTNKDITKIDTILNKPLIQVLNYLTWIKKENDDENRRIKSMRY